VEARNGGAQRVKTLAHELGHALLHESAGDRALAECEAESVAYVVCRALGVDSSGYTFGYVAGWAGGGEQAIAAVRASGTCISRTAPHCDSARDASWPGDAASRRELHEYFKPYVRRPATGAAHEVQAGGPPRPCRPAWS